MEHLFVNIVTFLFLFVLKGLYSNFNCGFFVGYMHANFVNSAHVIVYITPCEIMEPIKYDL